MDADSGSSCGLGARSGGHDDVSGGGEGGDQGRGEGSGRRGPPCGGLRGWHAGPMECRSRVEHRRAPGRQGDMRAGGGLGEGPRGPRAQTAHPRRARASHRRVLEGPVRLRPQSAVHPHGLLRRKWKAGQALRQAAALATGRQVDAECPAGVGVVPGIHARHHDLVPPRAGSEDHFFAG